MPRVDELQLPRRVLWLSLSELELLYSWTYAQRKPVLTLNVDCERGNDTPPFLSNLSNPLFTGKPMYALEPSNRYRSPDNRVGRQCRSLAWKWGRFITDRSSYVGGWSRSVSGRPLWHSVCGGRVRPAAAEPTPSRRERNPS